MLAEFDKCGDLLDFMFKQACEDGTISAIYKRTVAQIKKASNRQPD